MCHTHCILSHTDTHIQQSSQSAPHKTTLEHFEMNTKDSYGINTAEIATTGNIACMTAEDAIPATQNVAYEQVPSGMDECYDYVIAVYCCLSLLLLEFLLKIYSYQLVISVRVTHQE